MDGVYAQRIASPSGPARAAARSAGPLRSPRLLRAGPRTGPEALLHRLSFRRFQGSTLGRPRTNAARLLSPTSTRRAYFRRDHYLSIPGALLAGYRSTGFSRGHLVPARDVAHDEEALRDSFLLSNAVPQNSVMNRSSRSRLENQVRKLAEEADSVIVVTGAIFTERPDRIGAGGVAVPSALYK